MADNCSILEPWSALSAVGGYWAPDVLAHESEALTRALQASLSQPNLSSTTTSSTIYHHQQQQQDNLTSYLSSPSSLDLYSSPSSQFLPSPTTPASAPVFAKPDLIPVPGGPATPAAAAASESDSPTAANKKVRGAGISTGRVSKRRPSRASKQNPTTFINADPANFRQMVQEVTGVQIPALHGAGGCLSPASALLSRPEPLRVRDILAHHQGQLGAAPGVSWLPTLDTSDFLLDTRLLDRPAAAGPSSSSSPPPPPPLPAAAVGTTTAVAFSSGGLDMGLPCFPTLESSWEVM